MLVVASTSTSSIAASKSNRINLNHSQISTNVKAARVTPTPTAPTHQVHMPATVPAVIREMELIVKVKELRYPYSLH